MTILNIYEFQTHFLAFSRFFDQFSGQNARIPEETGCFFYKIRVILADFGQFRFLRTESCEEDAGKLIRGDGFEYIPFPQYIYLPVGIM
jgi:hypothetical protein